MPPPLIKARYGEPIAMRVYNNMPISEDRRTTASDATRRSCTSTTPTTARKATARPTCTISRARSTTTAGAPRSPAPTRPPTTPRTDKRASGPDGNGGLVKVPGDYRELQGTLWAHDHRFFFTAENVYKGNLMAVNMYSGPDRGNEALTDGVNLKLPSGKILDWGNLDFDVNLIVSDAALDQTGQLFFDIFDTDGSLGDLPLVNMAYAPYFDVVPRAYRFRILNASMSRFFKLAFSWNGNLVPFKFIANDGNLVVNPIQLTQLDEQGSAERYDVVVDFSQFRVGDKVYLVNLLKQTDGRRPDKVLSLSEALKGDKDDPVAGAIMEFRIDGLGAKRGRPGSHAHLCFGEARQGCRAERADGADPHRCTGARARGRVRPVGSGQLARRRRAVQSGLPGIRDLPVDHQDQRPGRAFHERQPDLAADSQARRGRALDLHQRRRRLGPPHSPSLRGRHNDRPWLCQHSRRRKSSCARTYGDCVRRGG